MEQGPRWPTFLSPAVPRDRESGPLSWFCLLVGSLILAVSLPLIRLKTLAPHALPELWGPQRSASQPVTTFEEQSSLSLGWGWGITWQVCFPVAGFL